MVGGPQRDLPMSRTTLPLAALAAVLFAYALFVLWAAAGLLPVILFAFGLSKLLTFAERRGEAERIRVEAAAGRRWPGQRRP